MKKFLMIFMLFSVMLMSAGCKNEEVAKESADKIASAMAPVIATALSCNNQVAIKADVEKLVLEKLFKVESLESKIKQKALGKTICIAAVTAGLTPVLEIGVGKLPHLWDCSGDLAMTTIKALAIGGCALLPF